MASILAEIGGSRVRMAHFFWKNTVRWGDSVIDATCGNGKDSLVLSRLMAETGPNNSGRFFGFDVQAQAIEHTRTRLHDAGIDMSKVRLYNEGHERMKAVIAKEEQESTSPLRVKLVTFNLGYLPGGDKSLHTQAHTTVEAVDAASQLIVPGGVVSVILYPHAAGQQEAASLRQWCKSLSFKDFVITNVMTPLDGETQPSILFITRRLQNAPPGRPSTTSSETLAEDLSTDIDR